MTSSRRLRVAQVGVGHFGAYRRERMRETGLFELVAAEETARKGCRVDVPRT